MANQQGDIKTISISVTADTSKAQQSITKLTNKVNNLKSALSRGFKAPSFKWATKLTESIDKLKEVPFSEVSNGIKSIAKSLDTLNGIKIDPNLAQQLSELIKLKKKMDTAGTKEKSYVPNWTTKEPIVATSTKREYGWEKTYRSSDWNVGNAKEVADEWRESAEKAANAGHSLSYALGGVGQAGEQVTGSLGDAQEKLNDFVATNDTFENKVYTLADIMRKLGFSASSTSTAIANLVDKIRNGFATALKKAASAMGKLLGGMMIAPFKKLGNSIATITKKLSGFLSALKRIAVYRAIRFMLKELTQAFREGISNLYQWSKAIDEQFSRSMDMLATSALYAKNSLAAMVEPIVNQVAPAIDLLVDKFVDVLNVVNELIASLTGAETWTAALKYPTEYAEAMDDATGSAKKLRATLLGFDEINRLDDNNKGSRGKAGDQLDYSKMFETRTVTKKAKNFVDAIKKAFKSGDLGDIGKSIGEKIKKGLDNIDWNSIQERVKKNATMVTTFINGFIDVDGLGASLGRTIAQAFNTAIGKMKTFFTGVKWSKLGSFLGDGFSAMMETFNFRDLASTLAAIINGGLDLISGFVNTVDWGDMAQFLADGINQFFDDVELGKLGKTISDVIINAIQFVHTFFKATDFEKIGEKIGDFINGIDWVNVLSGLAQLLYDAIGAAFDALVGLFKKSPLAGLVVGTAIANVIAGALGLPTVTSIIRTAVSGAVSSGMAGMTVSTTATSAMGTAMAGAVGSGATSASTAIKTGSTAAGVAAGVAMFALGAVAIGWLADAITDGESTRILEEAFGITLRNASHTGNPTPKEPPKTGTNWGKMLEDSANALKNLNDNLTDKRNKSLGEMKYSTFASGGVPSTGSLFLAGEHGAEVVASYGSSTSVYNRDQLANSVAEGNVETVAELRVQNDLLRQLVAKDTTVVTNITTDSITNALDRQNRRSGRAIVPVGV